MFSYRTDVVGFTWKTPLTLRLVLNLLAKEGFRVVSTASAGAGWSSNAGHGGWNSFTVTLERCVDKRKKKRRRDEEGPLAAASDTDPALELEALEAERMDMWRKKEAEAEASRKRAEDKMQKEA